MSLNEYTSKLNLLTQQKLSDLLPDTGIYSLIKAHPVSFIVGILILLSVLIIFIIVFFDFIVDAWKIPFAIMVDVLDMISFISPGMFNVYAAVGAFGVFAMLGDSKMKWIFAIIAAAEAFCSVLFPFNSALIGTILGIFPTTTLLMIIDAIID